MNAAAPAVKQSSLTAGALRRAARWLVTGLTVLGIAMTAALSFDYQERWGPSFPPEARARYVQFARAIDEWLKSTSP